MVAVVVVIASYLSNVGNFNLLACIWCPYWGDPFEFCQGLWHQKIRVSGLSCGVACMILCLAVSGKLVHIVNNADSEYSYMQHL